MRAAREVDTRRLLRDAKDGDPKAREQVIRRYERLLRGTASRYRGLGLPSDDLVQEGAIGLLEAIDSFEETRGTLFETFARWRIRRAITDALTAQSRLVRLPKQVVERRRAVSRTASELTAKHGVAPTTGAITAQTGLPLESVEAIQALQTVPVSLDARFADGRGTLLESIEDPAATDPEVEALALHRADVVADALERLPDREAHVIRRRYGFGGPEMTLVDVGRELHLCPQRTRAIEQNALYRLAKMLERDPTFRRAPWSEWTLEISTGPRGIRRRRGPGTRRSQGPRGRAPSNGRTRSGNPRRRRDSRSPAR